MKQVRGLLSVFMILLFLSGLTAIPIQNELSFLLKRFNDPSIIRFWLEKVFTAYTEVQSNHLFLLYGYDWLAFAHFILVILFIGPYIDPKKNIWVIEFGMIACCLVIPFALIAGHYRTIPFFWQLIDSSFGIFGFILLRICHMKILHIINYKKQKP
jgi:hypothetical protein